VIHHQQKISANSIAEEFYIWVKVPQISPVIGAFRIWHEVSYEVDKMLRDLLHIDSFKNVAEEVVNCWLTYAMSQPVNFNLAVITLFVLQYIGLNHVKNVVTRMTLQGLWNRVRR
jgi:hypothetical protein